MMMFQLNYFKKRTGLVSLLFVVLSCFNNSVKGEDNNLVEFPFIHELATFNGIHLGGSDICMSDGVEPILSYTIRQGDERKISMFPAFIAVPESVNGILSFRLNISAIVSADLGESGVLIEVPSTKSIQIKGFVPRVQIDANITDLTLLDDQSSNSYIKANFGWGSDPVNVTLKLAGSNSKVEIASTAMNTTFLFGEDSESVNEDISIHGNVVGGTIGGSGSTFLIQNAARFDDETGLWTKDAIANVTCSNKFSAWSLNGGRCTDNNIQFVDAADSVCKITMETVTTEPSFGATYDCRSDCTTGAYYSLTGECSLDDSGSMMVMSGLVVLLSSLLVQYISTKFVV